MASIIVRVTQILKCAICSDAIGVYEPLVVLNDFHVSRTALAVEPSAGDGADGVFHSDCVPTLRVTSLKSHRARSSHR